MGNAPNPRTFAELPAELIAAARSAGFDDEHIAFIVTTARNMGRDPEHTLRINLPPASEYAIPPPETPELDEVDQEIFDNICSGLYEIDYDEDDDGEERPALQVPDIRPDLAPRRP